ncbi:MAG: homocysteine S-methyltransferase family protein [Anaerovoracaceae bacterium]
MKFKDLLGKEIIHFDGAMGSLLQQSGLPAGYIPEYWNIEKPEVIKKIHKDYLDAGCNVIESNSFGANPAKMEDSKYAPYDLMYEAIKIAREAIKESGREDAFVAASLGTTGKLIEPLGEMTFDQAYEGYKTMWIAAKEAGADVLLCETMTDIYELKAAILAAKENTDLPVIASVMVNENGKLLTGADIKTIVAVLEGLRVDAIGLNCGFGPNQMAPFVREMLEETRLPMLVNPNAGLPKVQDGETVYDLTVEDFVTQTAEFVNEGVSIIGGCCGTTPEHIAKLVEAVKGMKVLPPKGKSRTCVSSYTHTVTLGDVPVIIGEKINPTGNKLFKEALKSEDMATVLKLAKEQVSLGANILDVNVGLPELDETKVITKVMKEIQGVLDVPLMIDTSNVEAMETAARYYNGKPFLNSVNGKAESMDSVFKVAQKYGGVLIALTLDESGIPKTAQGRYDIAKKIIDRAAEFGISKEDIVVDPLTLTVSAEGDAAKVTLETIKLIKEGLGVKTSLGVSNVSFGLPSREDITATFYTMALNCGLDAAIMNPFSKKIMGAYYGYKALMGMDKSCKDYIGYFENGEKDAKTQVREYSLVDSILSGLKEDAKTAATLLLKEYSPLEIIDNHIIKALQKVGEGFEKGDIYLPQLLMSAEAAQTAFEVIKTVIGKDGAKSKGKIVLATVKGDIHDIGKNIVKVLLENYGYEVIDLGKDVAPKVILEAVQKEKVQLVGLSALMTTTVPSMEATIKLIRESHLDCKVVVGGAVLNEEYAKMIDADCYCKDAMATVRFAEQLYNR